MALIKLDKGYINPDAIDHIFFADETSSPVVLFRSGQSLYITFAELAYLTESTDADEAFIGAVTKENKTELSLSSRIANYLKEQPNGASLTAIYEYLLTLPFAKFTTNLNVSTADAIKTLIKENVIILLNGEYFHKGNPVAKSLITHDSIPDPFGETSEW